MSAGWISTRKEGSTLPVRHSNQEGSALWAMAVQARVSRLRYDAVEEFRIHYCLYSIHTGSGMGLILGSNGIAAIPRYNRT